MVLFLGIVFKSLQVKENQEAADQNGYSVYALSAPDPRGPFTPKPESFRLSGTSQAPTGKETMHSLGAWVHDYYTGEPLISNYMMSSLP